MLKHRLATSAVLIAALLVLIYLDLTASPVGLEGIWLLPALLFFALGTTWDVTSMLKASGRHVSRSTGQIATLIVTLSPCVPMLWPLFGATYPEDCPIGTTGWLAVAGVIAVFFVFLFEMSYYDGGRQGAIERTLTGTFVSLYVGMPMAMLVLIRRLDADVDPSWGLWLLLTTIATTKAADTGAYFTGKSIGRHKLIPRLSPGKTWEGLVGGVITATIVAAVCLHWAIPAISGSTTIDTAGASHSSGPWWGFLLLGPLLALAGLVGDLAESLIKRDAGVKDSGDWLPGLGGVWDVTDSLISASMPAFVLYAAGMAG